MKNFKSFAKTPPMGWNSWDCYGAGVTEKELLENADYMAKNLKQYGWEYIVCDIQWYEPNAKGNEYNNFAPLCMDEWGRLIPAKNRFPSSAGGKGFAPIAEYVHKKGLKFGIHIMRGVPRQAAAAACPIKGSEASCRDIAHHFSICSWNTDMYGLKNCEDSQAYYDSLFDLYASWGVDFVKCDDIAVTEYRKWDNPYSADYEIEMIRKAIDRCGREIVLSLSPGPARLCDSDHLEKNANMWRLTGDFWDRWDKLYEMFGICEKWQGKTKTGSYPDCDMLPIGKLCKDADYHGKRNRMSSFTHDEQYTLMTLWGIFSSPLFIGGNLPDNDEFTLSLLTNAEYIKMNQNGKNARQLLRNEKNGGGTIIWTSSGKNEKYLAIFNTSEKAKKIKVNLSDILMPSAAYSVFDIWKNQELPPAKNSIAVAVNPHGAALLKLK